MTKQNKNQNQSTEAFQAYGKYDYSFAPKDQPGDSAATEPVQKPQKKVRKSGSVFFRVFAFLAILAVALVVVMKTCFRLEAVCVIGHKTYSAQKIINLSGLTYEQNLFAISEEEIAANLQKDHTIILKDVQVKIPNMIYLQIEERYPVAILEWGGVHYLVDKDWLVMKVYSESESLPQLPMIKGVEAFDVSKGQFVPVKSKQQMTAYDLLIDELYMQHYEEQIKEIRLRDPENIYLVTRDGLNVQLGKAEDLERKLRAMRTVIAYLRALDKNTGLLDVNVPTEVKFSPSKG